MREEDIAWRSRTVSEEERPIYKHKKLEIGFNENAFDIAPSVHIQKDNIPEAILEGT